jgi:hypothetical protein
MPAALQAVVLPILSPSGYSFRERKEGCEDEEALGYQTRSEEYWQLKREVAMSASLKCDVTERKL